MSDQLRELRDDLAEYPRTRDNRNDWDDGFKAFQEIALDKIDAMLAAEPDVCPDCNGTGMIWPKSGHGPSSCLTCVWRRVDAAEPEPSLPTNDPEPDPAPSVVTEAMVDDAAYAYEQALLPDPGDNSSRPDRRAMRAALESVLHVKGQG
jgi:hypothetical protein